MTLNLSIFIAEFAFYWAFFPTYEVFEIVTSITNNISHAFREYMLELQHTWKARYALSGKLSMGVKCSFLLCSFIPRFLSTVIRSAFYRPMTGSQSPSRCVESQFLLGCLTRTSEACWRPLFLASIESILRIISCMLSPAGVVLCVTEYVLLFLSFLSHCHSVPSLLCLWVYDAVWCHVLFVCEVSYLWHPHTFHRMTSAITCLNARCWEQKVCV